VSDLHSARQVLSPADTRHPVGGQGMEALAASLPPAQGIYGRASASNAPSAAMRRGSARAQVHGWSKVSLRLPPRRRTGLPSPAYRLRIARASPAHQRAASFAQSAGVGSHRPRSDSERCGRGRRVTRAPRPFLQRSARNVPQARDRPAVGASAAPSRHSIGASAQHHCRITAASLPHHLRITAALLPHPRGFIRAL